MKIQDIINGKPIRISDRMPLSDIFDNIKKPTSEKGEEEDEQLSD